MKLQHRGRNHHMLQLVKNGKWAYLFAALVSLVTVIAVAVACGGDDDDGSKTPAAPATPAATATTAAGSPTPAGIAANIGKDDKAELTGAGATFPAPIYISWFDYYKSDIATGVKINYQSIGSG